MQQAPTHMRVNQSVPNLASVGQQIMTPGGGMHQNQQSVSFLPQGGYDDHNPVSMPTRHQQQIELAGNNLRHVISYQDPYIQDQEENTKLQKRLQHQQLQQEQLLQMEERKRKLEIQRLEEKRKDEELEIKLAKERQQMEDQVLKDYDENIRKYNKNLNESLDPNVEKALRDRKQKEFYQNQKNEYNRTNYQVKPVMNDDDRPPTPPPDKYEMDIDHQRQKLLIQQRVIRELPIEITSQVQNTINQELMKLRNEISYQQNHLGEQMLNLRGAIITTNNEKHRVMDDIKDLKKNLQKTQYLDEIRQREIYNAFVFQNKPNYYISNTEKLIEPELQPFVPPKRPRPYYNQGDPYLEGFHAKHHHQPLANTTEHVNYVQKHKELFGEKNIDEKYFQKQKVNPIDDEHWKDYFKHGDFNRNGVPINGDVRRANIPDDHKNRQGLQIPRDQDLDIQHILVKNQNRIDALDEVIDRDERDGIDELDTALFKNLLKRDNEPAYRIGPKTTVKLHYQYKDGDKYVNNHFDNHNIADYDNNRSKMFEYPDP